MGPALIAVGGLAILVGVSFYGVGESMTHEVEGMIAFLIAAVFISGGLIVDNPEQLRGEMRDRAP